MAQISYTARQAGERVQLTDIAHGIEATIVPSLGSRAIELLVNGQNILHVPSSDVAVLKADGHTNGIPFLAPWANRMPEGFWANGKHYRFNPDLDSIRADQNGIPIHGLLTASPFWEVIDCTADENSAQVTSRLEFWKYPDYMANWPFAHAYEMTYRLANGVFEVAVVVRNLGTEPMPVAIGFHPYFQIPGVPWKEAKAHLPVSRHVETDARLVATGETRPVSLPVSVYPAERHFDDGFIGLTGEPFSVDARKKRIEVRFGSKYTVAIVYAPPGGNFICFEPMTAITNGVNLAHEGKYDALQTVTAGAEWRESFWISPTGF